MANHVHAFSIAISDDGQLHIAIDQVAGIHRLTIHLASQRSARQTSTDAGGDLRHRYRRIKGALGTIGKRYDWHIRHLQSASNWQKKSAG